MLTKLNNSNSLSTNMLIFMNILVKCMKLSKIGFRVHNKSWWELNIIKSIVNYLEIKFKFSKINVNNNNYKFKMVRVLVAVKAVVVKILQVVRKIIITNKKYLLIIIIIIQI